MADMITIDDVRKLDLRIGRIDKAEPIAGADKLLKLDVDLGSEHRQVVAGIAKVYQPDQLTGKQVVVVANLAPRMLRGVESQGMVMAADHDGTPILLCPDQEVPQGAQVR
ncbi:MAG: methionine--tRNA ligase subunit beta [Candidatus Aenigmarchaeota archaeon]|nr:methionine--tRNA ligase subunit beta [Candidatus Aenigmarchaeota archaeon]